MSEHPPRPKLSPEHEAAPQYRYNKKQLKTYTKEIAAQLGETDEKPIRQIQTMISLCGIDLVRELVADTMQIEAQGGMMVDTGHRRRTVGGVFFQLARMRLAPEEREQVFFGWKAIQRERKEREAQYPPFYWETRVEQLAGKLADKGEVVDVKVTLYGQPGSVERRQDVVITLLEEQPEAMPSIPTGVPPIPTEPMQYLVYISAKQWERVAPQVGKSDDPLLVEGYCRYDPVMNNVAVFATYVSTKKTDQRDKKIAKAAKSGGDARTASRKPPTTAAPEKPKDKAKRSEALPTQSAPPPPDFPIPANVPPQVAQKLVELYTAAATFRQKLSTLEAKPADQQAGIEMTRKLLASTEKQIEALEKQYTAQG